MLDGFGIIREGQQRGFIEVLFAAAAKHPERQAYEGNHYDYCAKTANHPNVHHTSPFAFDDCAEALQVGDHGIHFSLAFNRCLSAGNVFIGVRHAHGT